MSLSRKQVDFQMRDVLEVHPIRLNIENIIIQASVGASTWLAHLIISGGRFTESPLQFSLKDDVDAERILRLTWIPTEMDTLSVLGRAIAPCNSPRQAQNPPDPPTDFQVNNLAHDKVTATWAESAGATSYEVDNGFGWFERGDTNSFTVKLPAAPMNFARLRCPRIVLPPAGPPLARAELRADPAKRGSRRCGRSPADPPGEAPPERHWAIRSR